MSSTSSVNKLAFYTLFLAFLVMTERSNSDISSISCYMINLLHPTASSLHLQLSMSLINFIFFLNNFFSSLLNFNLLDVIYHKLWPYKYSNRNLSDSKIPVIYVSQRQIAGSSLNAYLYI